MGEAPKRKITLAASRKLSTAIAIRHAGEMGDSGAEWGEWDYAVMEGEKRFKATLL